MGNKSSKTNGETNGETKGELPVESPVQTKGETHVGGLINKFGGTAKNPVKPRTLVLLGNTGVGKSYITEELMAAVGKDVTGIVGGGIDSTTTRCTLHQSDCASAVLDTPGLADTDGRTLQFLRTIASHVNRAPGCVPAICLPLDEKFTQQTTTALKALSLMFGLENCDYLLVVNKARTSKRSTFTIAGKCSGIISGVTDIIGRAPKSHFVIEFDEDFKAADLWSQVRAATPAPQCLSFDDLMRMLESDQGRVGLIQQRLENCTVAAKFKRFGAAFADTYKKTWDAVRRGNEYGLNPTERVLLAVNLLLPTFQVLEGIEAATESSEPKPTPEEVAELKALKQNIDNTVQRMDEVLAYYKQNK